MNKIVNQGANVSRTARDTKVLSLRASLVAVCAMLGFMLLMPALASAVFTRPFLREIPGVPGASFEGPEVAVDKQNDLWVADGSSGLRLDEFSPAYQASEPNAFLSALAIGEIGSSTSVAIEQASGHFYVVAGGGVRNGQIDVFDTSGKSVASWKNEHLFDSGATSTTVAVDNSENLLEDPSACSVSGCTLYVSHGGENQPPSGDGLPIGIEKLDSEGTLVEFSAAKKCAEQKCGYISGPEITGTPKGAFTVGNLRSVAVDAAGDIYAAVDSLDVAEFRASGEYVRSYSIGEGPHLGEGFSGINSLAVDPVSGHLLVTLYNSSVPQEGAVDEFDTGTGKFVSQITATAPGERLQSAFGVSVDSHGDTYVVDQVKHVVDVYGRGLFLPSLRLGAAGERTATAAVLNGAVNPEGLTLSDCHFEYVTEAAFEQNVQAHKGLESEGFADLSSGGQAPCVPSAGGIASDDSFHAVRSDVAGLASGTTYRYRLVAHSEGTEGGTAASASLAFTAPQAPSVSASAENVSSRFVDLHAQIGPLGADTTYYFQYVDAAGYEAGAVDPYAAGVAIPATPEDIGAGGPTGGALESVVQHAGGLTPGTVYHFRVVAHNEYGTSASEDQTFTTLALALPGLPDGRAYELVTPANKSGGNDMFAEPETNGEFSNTQSVGYPTSSGNGFVFEAFSAFGSFPAANHGMYAFSRTAAGWRFTPVVSPGLGVQTIGNGDAVFDMEDLSRVAFLDGIGTKLGPDGLRHAVLVGAPGGPYTTLHSDPTLYEGLPESSEHTEIVGASRNLGHLVLESDSTTLCPGAEALQHGAVLCEWAGGFEESVEGAEPKPQLKLVNTLEGSLSSRCGASLGSGNVTEGGGNRSAVSVDGSREIFTAPDPKAEGQGSGCWNGANEHAPQVYVHVGASDSTLELSAPEPGVKEAGSKEPGERPVQYPANYVGASEDGSKVFFVTETWLTADHPQGHDRELYECEIIEESEALTCKLHRISAGEVGSPDSTAGARVYQVPAISASGSSVYFLAFGALVNGGGASSLGTSRAGPVNLYHEDTVTGTTKYIATVNASDYPVGPGGACGSPVLNVEPSTCATQSWYGTPDGRYLLFSASLPIDGFNTLTGCPVYLPRAENNSDGRCEELYRYDSSNGSLVCASCDPSGEAPISNAEFDRSAAEGPTNSPVRAMSDDGAYVFFDSADRLVPAATNGSLNVYEWHEGRISLIDPGNDPAPSYFMGASSDGSNVFFATHASLVPQDTNAGGDIYDARVCTSGDPCIAPPAGTTAQCEGDACQSPALAPIDATPTSLSLSGVGNAQPTPPAPPKETAAQIRAQKLTEALKACRSRRGARQRRRCGAVARKRYGPKTVAKPKSNRLGGK
jgi:hypothetical protein